MRRFPSGKNDTIWLRRRMRPASYQSAKLEAQSAWAKAEADMFQAQLDYRLAYTQLKGIMGGR